MKVLFLVHVEESFREEFPDRMYVNRLLRALRVYDRVICLVSHIMDYEPIPELTQSYRSPECWQWGWGYEENVFHEDEEKNWVIPAYGHEYTWVPLELRDANAWKNCEISVGGGCIDECLRDFIDVLEYVGIDHRVVDGYCY